MVWHIIRAFSVAILLLCVFLLFQSVLLVADTAKVAFNLKQSNLLDSNVALHMHLTLALSSAHVKYDVQTDPYRCIFCAFS